MLSKVGDLSRLKRKSIIPIQEKGLVAFGGGFFFLKGGYPKVEEKKKRGVVENRISVWRVKKEKKRAPGKRPLSWGGSQDLSERLERERCVGKLEARIYRIIDIGSLK